MNNYCAPCVELASNFLILISTKTLKKNLHEIIEYDFVVVKKNKNSTHKPIRFFLVKEL